MEIRCDDVVTHPIELVYEAMRDRLPEVTPFFQGVDSIEVVEKEVLGPGKLRLLNHWHGNRSVAPKAVRPFLTANLRSWIDHAEWDDARRAVRWRFETFHFGKLFDCQGENRFESTGDGHTRIIIQGTLDLYPERVPGVPKFLARKLKPSIEKFILDLLGSNLADLAKGLQKFLDRG